MRMGVRAHARHDTHESLGPPPLHAGAGHATVSNTEHATKSLDDDARSAEARVVDLAAIPVAQRGARPRLVRRLLALRGRELGRRPRRLREAQLGGLERGRVGEEPRQLRLHTVPEEPPGPGASRGAGAGAGAG